MILRNARKAWNLLRHPEQLEVRWIFYRQNQHKLAVKRLPKWTRAEIKSVLKNTLGIQNGNTVCVHSAVGFLNLDFAPAQLLELLLESVGPTGTLVFPTYPGASHEFLKQKQTFDVRHSSSVKSTGLLTDLAWRHPGARRSLHPTKSMAAIGPQAAFLLDEHHLSPFPYDRTSPYFKLSQVGAKIIGLGVWTYNLSFVHCVEDTMKENFPFCPHEPELFTAVCVDATGESKSVLTYAHDLPRISYDTLHVQDYMRSHVDKNIARDFSEAGRRLFTVDAANLYPRMVDLAKDGITIFKRAAKSADAKTERKLWIKLQEQARSQNII